jgi:hypothetical protein
MSHDIRSMVTPHQIATIIAAESGIDEPTLEARGTQ